MKFTQKWMVVPYDKNYALKHQNSHQILKNKVLPSDVKTKLFDELLTKMILKQNPEKQLPVETTQEPNDQETKNLENNYKNITNELENRFKTEDTQKVEDLMDIDEETVAKAKKKIPLRAKRLLERSMNQSISIPKKTRKKNKEFNFELEDAPYQNTRNQKIQYKLNTAQFGNGWLRFK